MGVPGLTTFIDCNTDLLKDHKLHDTKIVIDGNNLFHFLYYYFNVYYEYGGDYDVYRKFVKSFFATLGDCNIEAIVVFDGGHSDGDKKLRTSLRRAKERIHLCGFLSHAGRGKVLPILVYETFRSVMDELGIKYATCDFEADEQIAALANHLECPVLTNDSDFFIYNLKGGMVLLDYLNLKQHTDDANGNKYILVQIYKLNHLLKKFTNLTAEGLALFATLHGNDFVDARTFENFFSTVKLPKASSDKLHSPRKQTRMASLLQWIDSFLTPAQAVQMILRNTKKETRARMETLLAKSVESYSKLTAHVYLLSEEETALSETSLRTYAGDVIPGWFIHKLHTGQVPVFMVNVLVLHRVFLLSQIEMMDKVNAYRTSLGIRRLIYGILLTSDLAEEMRGDSPESQATRVLEYSREGKLLKKSFIKPVFNLSNGVAVPSLSQIPQLSPSEKLQFLYKAMDVKSEGISEDLREIQVLIAAVTIWIRDSDPKIKFTHLLSLLVCALKLYIIDPLGEAGASKSNDANSADSKKFCGLRAQALEMCAQEHLQRAQSNLERFTTPVKHTRLLQFNGNCLHAFAQLQAAFIHTLYLSQLLCLPGGATRPDELFNGTLFYSLHRELESRTNPQLYSEELLVRDSFLSRLLNRILEIVKGQFSDDIFDANVSSTGKKHTKKTHKKVSKAPVKVAEKDSGASSENDDEDDDIDNRFACLSVTED